MRNTLKKTFLFLTIFIIGACNINASSNQDGSGSSNNKKIEVFEVAEHQVFCEQIVPRKCLYIKREGKKNYKALWDQIENFRYIPGYRYVLKVEVEKIARPPKDTSGFKYYLKEIVTRQRTDSYVHENIFLSKWFLTHIKGKKIEGGKPFVVFKKGEAKFYGNSGCNSFGGSYKIADYSISFSRIRQTKRACQFMQSVETPFTSILGGQNKIKVEYDRLYFEQDGIVVLEFKSNWAE